jgi:hypothetical protein
MTAPPEGYPTWANRPFDSSAIRRFCRDSGADFLPISPLWRPFSHPPKIFFARAKPVFRRFRKQVLMKGFRRPTALRFLAAVASTRGNMAVFRGVYALQPVLPKAFPANTSDCSPEGNGTRKGPARNTNIR